MNNELTNKIWNDAMNSCGIINECGLIRLDEALDPISLGLTEVWSLVT